MRTWSQSEVADASFNILIDWIIDVRIEDLLGEGKGSIKTASNNLEVLDQLFVRQSRVLKTFY